MLKTILKNIVVRILEWEAKLVLRKYKPKIIAVTGNVGKTSVKEAIYTVLKSKYKVRKSEKSYNSEFGVPLTIINRPTAWNSVSGWLSNIFEGLALIIFPNRYPDWLILEVGADRPGDIAKTAKWLKPDVAIITRLPDVPVHVEFFPSVEELVAEKMSLAKAVSPDGLVILNGDDQRIMALKDSIKAPVVTYGFNEGVEVRAFAESSLYDEDKEILAGLAYKIAYAGETYEAKIKGALGKHHVYTTLAAFTVAVKQGLKPAEAVEALASYVTPPGRMRIIPGLKGSTIIDDSYNASPAAMEAGLETVAEADNTKRKFAVLGDMLELGEHTIEAHKTLGRFAVGKVDQLILIGLRSKFIAEGALEAGMDRENILHFSDAREAGLYLQNEIQYADLIYVKGSQLIRLEKTVEEIMLHPEDKEKLLCRQDPEWRKR